MKYAEWTKNLETKIDFVDRDHAHLFDLVNQLYEAMTSGKGKDVTAGILKELVDYSNSHFLKEEAMLEKRGFPGLSSHKVLHAKFVEKVNEVKVRHEQGALLLNVELLKFLKTWLNDHIAIEDKTYVVYLDSQHVAVN